MWRRFIHQIPLKRRVLSQTDLILGTSATTTGPAIATWTDPAYVLDEIPGQYAVLEIPSGWIGVTDYLHVTGFDPFWVTPPPANAVITGVGLAASVYNSNADFLAALYCRLRYNGAFIGAAKFFTPSEDSGDGPYFIGGRSDMWGTTSLTLTPTMVNDTTFGVSLYGYYGESDIMTLNVAWVKLIIFYAYYQ